MLARKKRCEHNLLENINYKIDEKEYHHRHRDGDSSFIRRRKLTFKHIVVFLMNLVTRSLQRELNHFFKVIQSGEFDVHHVSKSAFTQARAKLKHTAFVELNDFITDDFYANMPWMSWLGHRVLSSDGSTMTLPDSPQLRECYSIHRFGSGEREKVIARISQLYDPLNDIILNATVGQYRDGEQTLNRTHFPHLKSGDVLLMDRYYAARWLFAVLLDKGVHFVCRLQEKWWKEAREMIASGLTEKIVQFSVGNNHLSLLDQYGVKDKKITCRLIVHQLDNGEKMILCTSLLEKNTYSAQRIVDLYEKRWGIEESYKTLKCRMDIENFTGKTPKAILQDFYVKIFLQNLCTYITLDQQVNLEHQENLDPKKHHYKINKSLALSSLKDLPVLFFIKRNIKSALKAFKELIKNYRIPIRPGRKFNRRPSIRKLSKMNYKPI